MGVAFSNTAVPSLLLSAESRAKICFSSSRPQSGRNQPHADRIQAADWKSQHNQHLGWTLPLLHVRKLGCQQQLFQIGFLSGGVRIWLGPRCILLESSYPTPYMGVQRDIYCRHIHAWSKTTFAMELEIMRGRGGGCRNSCFLWLLKMLMKNQEHSNL